MGRCSMLYVARVCFQSPAQKQHVQRTRRQTRRMSAIGLTTMTKSVAARKANGRGLQGTMDVRRPVSAHERHRLQPHGPLCNADFRRWPLADMPRRLLPVRYRVESGL